MTGDPGGVTPVICMCMVLGLYFFAGHLAHVHVGHREKLEAQLV